MIGAEVLLAKYLSIDPGLYSTGWAAWSKEWELLETGLWTSSKGSWEDRAKFISLQLSKFLGFYIGHSVKTIACEFPKIYNTPKGLQIGLDGSIEKLTFLVGAFAGIANEREIVFQTVPVIEWKGQLPKEVVKHRIISLLGESKTKSFKADIWDAVGIGLFKAGRF